jgi:Ase1/PRC1/MAP65 family protein
VLTIVDYTLQDPKWDDLESDLTNERRNHFHIKRAEMKEELNSRTAAVIQIVSDCQNLMHDLRMEPENDGSLIDRQIAGSLVRSKDGSFMMASKFRTNTCIGINAKAVEQLTKRVAELHGEKRRRKTLLQEMGASIATLWEKLRVSEEVQIAFTESVQGLGLDTVEKGKLELKRLHELKSVMLGKLVEEARESISELWDQINASSDQRLAFQPFYVQGHDCMNDELLEQHDEYIAILEGKLEQMKPILRIIERREIVVRERLEYEELQKDPERLKQRGAAMTRHLLEEEKMARRIKRDLPRLTEILIEKLSEWKSIHREDFLFEGAVYLDTMNRQEDDWHLYKALEQERKQKKKLEEMVSQENRAPIANAVFPKKREVGTNGRSVAENNLGIVKRDTSRVRGIHELADHVRPALQKLNRF